MSFLERNANSGSVSTGYDIDNSCKFESDNSEYLERDPSSAGDRQKFTTSMWVKRTEIGLASSIFSVYPASSPGNTNVLQFGFMSDDRFQLGLQTYYSLQSTRVFRDTSAWYHIVLAVDTTQSTSTNRFKVYINGVLERNWDTEAQPAQNHTTGVNFTEPHRIGTLISNSWYFSGYIAEVNHVDGSQLAPTDFGEFDDTGIWIPKEYTGSYGTNGFYLDFADGSDLGDDESGNGNDFTEVNIAAADQATDTCTNNFCTLNPLIPYAVQSGAPVISNGATFHNGSGGWTGMKGTIGINKGKWYWELSMGGAGGGVSVIHGIQTVTSASGESTATSAHNLLETAAFYTNGGHWIKDETSGRDDIAASSITHTPGNTVVYAVALNMDDGEITYYANGSVISGLNEVDLDGLAGETVAPFASVYNQQLAWNFGGYTTLSISSAASDANGYGTFEYAPPSGYYSLCTKNLAEYG